MAMPNYDSAATAIGYSNQLTNAVPVSPLGSYGMLRERKTRITMYDLKIIHELYVSTLCF